MMVTRTEFIPHLTMPKKSNVILIKMVTATGTNFELLSYFYNDGQWDQFGTTVVTETNFNLVYVLGCIKRPSYQPLFLLLVLKCAICQDNSLCKI